MGRNQPWSRNSSVSKEKQAVCSVLEDKERTILQEEGVIYHVKHCHLEGNYNKFIWTNLRIPAVDTVGALP